MSFMQSNMATNNWIFLLGVLLFATCSFTVGQDQQQRGTMKQSSKALNPFAYTSGWGEWSSWTTCSRSCGGGISVRRRDCLRRRSSYRVTSPSSCLGPNGTYRSCNLITCQDRSSNTKRAQCANYNSRVFYGETYLWDPIFIGGHCRLSCKARGHRFFLHHSTQLRNGITCRGENGGGRHICVEGKCLEIGCDQIIGSRQVIDNCGVCGGNGMSCTFEQGLYRTETLTYDFHVVVTIPAGSTRINITEMADTRSFLALRSSTSNGQFFINGEINLGRPDLANRGYMVAGTNFDYRRPFKVGMGETMMADGPTNEDLDVLIYFQGENPGIKYEYTIPKVAASSSQTTIQDPIVDDTRHGLLDQHDETGRRHNDVGGRYNIPIPQSDTSILKPNLVQPPYNRDSDPLYDRNNLNPYYIPPPSYPRNDYTRQNRVPRPSVDGDLADGNSNSQNSDYETDGANKKEFVDSDVENNTTQQRREVPALEINRSENIGETLWRSSKLFGPCTKSCAGGIKVTTIQCINVETDQPVDDRYCDVTMKPKVKTRKCNRQTCPAFYDIGAWSECSRTCGNGRRTRRVACRQDFPNNFTAIVSHKRCRGLAKPRAQEKCRERVCAHWEIVSDWSSCSVNCGTGTQIREAVCTAGKGKILSESACHSSRRPTHTRPCEAGPCMTKWFVTDWEECSADCDHGLQRRDVFCLNTADHVAGCSSRIKPNATRACARSTCGTKYQWFTGDWEPCSSKCGNGVQARKVTCLSVSPNGVMSVAESVKGQPRCDESRKPASKQPCNTQSCGSRWHYTSWNECSVSCGGGSRTRDVQCLDANGRYSSLCSIQDRPTEAERCNTVNCFSFRDPSCQDQLERCKLVLQARLCGYPYYQVKCCQTCYLPRTNILRL